MTPSSGAGETPDAADDGRVVRGQPWFRLAADYERSRLREDSLDRLLEWPAQRQLLGDVNENSVLDVGCGSGAKLAELVGVGATGCVGVDISGQFIIAPPAGLELLEGDLSNLETLPQLTGRRFDRVLFLQSLGYATDQVETLRTAGALLANDGFIVVSRSHPIRYAVERAEKHQTSLGEEYFSTEPYSYRSGWNDQITLTHQTSTIADMINVFSDAGLWIETVVEPQLPADVSRRYPHKQAWLNRYLGILIFKLRPRPVLDVDG